MVVRSPFKSSTSVRNEMLLGNPDAPSARTVRRILYERVGLASYQPAFKPLLSEGQRKARRDFCAAHADWLAEDWATVLFSDECTFRQFAALKTYVRRPPNERYNERYTVPTVKFSRGVMAWGSISSRGAGALWIFPSGHTMIGHDYTTIMKMVLEPTMTDASCTIFQQDNCTCHRAATKWVQDDTPYTTLTWPGNSADLSPIENVWPLMKRYVSERGASNVTELADVIVDAWNAVVTPELCAKLVRSMPERIQACLQARGGTTRF